MPQTKLWPQIYPPVSFPVSSDIFLPGAHAFSTFPPPSSKIALRREKFNNLIRIKM